MSDRPYADPYLAGVGLGLVLLVSFVVTGRGLGASGAFASGAAGLVVAAAPGEAASNAYFARYMTGDGPWREWLLFEIGGVMIGGFLSALFAGRVRVGFTRGPRASRGGRIAAALGGGAIMGAGAVLARGCTSGLALSGGAMLAAGSWLFMLAVFVAGHLVAPLAKRVWQ